MSDMKGVYKVCAKREEKEGKVWWDDTGYRIFIGEWEGKPSVNLFDARLGAKFPAFKIEKQESPKNAQNAASAGLRKVPPPTDGDCPF